MAAKTRAQLLDEAFSQLHLAVAAIVKAKPEDEDDLIEWERGLEMVREVRDGYYAQTVEAQNDDQR